MELKGKNQYGQSYSVSLAEDGLVFKEGDDDGNSNSEFISFDEIEEIFFNEGKTDKGELEVKLLDSDRRIKIQGIKDNNLVDKFLDFTDDSLSDEQVSEEKLDSSDTDTSCPNCGTIFKKDSKFCKNCGKPLKSSINSSNNKICNNCGFINDFDADFCQKCGSELSITPFSVRCPYCAEEINPGAVKCKHCGEWLNKETKIQSNSDNHTVAIILGYFFSLLGGIIGLIFAFYLLSQKNKSARLHGLIMIFIFSIWLLFVFILTFGLYGFVPIIPMTFCLILILVGVIVYSRK